MLDGLLCFTTSDDQATVAVRKRRAGKALTNVRAYRLRGLQQLVSMEESSRPVGQPSDRSRELFRCILDREVAMLCHGGKLSYTALDAS